jgi:hypothetical protein
MIVAAIVGVALYIANRTDRNDEPQTTNPERRTPNDEPRTTNPERRTPNRT